MKLTNDEREKVKLMYYGCQVIMMGSYCDSSRILWKKGEVVTSKIWSYTSFLDETVCIPLLTQLDKITDEHAIEVAKIIIPEWKRPEDYKPIVYKKDDQLFMNIQGYEMVHIFFDGTLMYKDKDGVDCYTLKALQAYDQLREWGYALPYKGRSLFELGIAQEKQ